MLEFDLTIFGGGLLASGGGGLIALGVLACVSVVGVLVLFGLKRKGLLPAAAAKEINNVNYSDLRSGGYELITKLILLGEGQGGTVLVFAGIEELPVTISVNIAITLSKAGKKCLLVDTDAGRDAVAKVFDIENTEVFSGTEARPYETDFEGLQVWAGHNFSDRRGVGADELVRGAVTRFDFVVVNAPQIKQVGEWDKILEAASQGVIYSSNASQAEELMGAMKAANCEIIANIIA